MKLDKGCCLVHQTVSFHDALECNMAKLSKKHKNMLSVLIKFVLTESTNGVFFVVSEWLGYAPFGVYIWINVGTKTNVDQEFELEGEFWDSVHFEYLAKHEWVVQLKKTQDSPDGMDETIKYKLTEKAYNHCK